MGSTSGKGCALAKTGVRIRSAVLGDAPAVCAVVRRSITECCIEDHHNDPELLGAWLGNKTVAAAEAWIQSSQTRCLVAEQDGVGLVGFAMLRGDQLLLCYLLPEVRLQGVGRALLQALEADAVSRGVSVLRLDSTRAAETFYRRNGFKAVGPRPSSRGLSGLPMSKAIGHSVTTSA